MKRNVLFIVTTKLISIPPGSYRTEGLANAKYRKAYESSSCLVHKHSSVFRSHWQNWGPLLGLSCQTAALLRETLSKGKPDPFRRKSKYVCVLKGGEGDSTIPVGSDTPLKREEPWVRAPD